MGYPAGPGDKVAAQIEMEWQGQLDDLRAEVAQLRRDQEVMRKRLAAVDKRENAHYRDVLDKLSRGGFDIAGRAPQAEEAASTLILATGEQMTGALARAAQIFCDGPILDAVQRARVFPDSKTFVDMPLRDEPEKVLEAFHKLSEADRQDAEKLRAFVDSWFLEAGSDSEPWLPPDYCPEPPQLMAIASGDMREWALEINHLWSILGKKQIADVTDNPQRYSMIPRTYPMVVPGGRFRETYYWDTYWIVRGLLICNMIDTARGLVQNFLDTVTKLGFVPNGGRIYYLDRSQPPMLTAMVAAVYQETKDKEWLSKALPILEKEYRFWMDPKGGRLVEMPRMAGAGERHVLNIYRSVRTTPRPESYYEDIEAFREAEPLGRSCAEVYQALCSGAESGWDFSARWLEDGTGRVPLGTANLGTIDTCHVIPADLNSMLYYVERQLATFHKEVSPGSEGEGMAAKYEAAAAAREHAMSTWLWAGDSYRDYRLDTGTLSAVLAISDWSVPLWAGLKGPDPSSTSMAMVLSLKRSGLLRLCGCASTSADTLGRTQWDAPNAWPPMMLMLIEGLDQVAGAEALADCLSDTWLRSNYITWQRTGAMHEKYDVFEPGRYGGGGEYEPQVGFGWTNGTVLALLVRPPRVTQEPVSPRYARKARQVPSAGDVAALARSRAASGTDLSKS
eukprot:TRINITY_DN22147_c0_g1_i1.p1 TRINITY_DN22147_c0_g1~~TRINITY_DN22147_c0_g1_i1.p1  ORF type:complete len:701 (+),score=90.74 TRINITY_DN22147_c0_g1_i1:74-2104(+)